MRHTLLLLLFLLPLSAQESGEIHHDAYSLREQLVAPSGGVEQTAKWAFGLGYVMGIAETDGQGEFCLPQNFRAGEIKDVIVKFMNDHPEKLHERRVDVAIAALHLGFPCPSEQK
jgi:hypothetical protein